MAVKCHTAVGALVIRNPRRLSLIRVPSGCSPNIIAPI
jgi:hypothetical protein